MTIGKSHYSYIFLLRRLRKKLMKESENMERERKGKNYIIAALLVTVVSLSVAFAATLTTQLNINGTTKMEDAKWDVKFTSAKTTAATTVENATEPTLTNETTITYNVTLKEGTAYVFDAVVANEGTYDAKLQSLTLAGAEGYESLVTYGVTGVTQGTTVVKAGTTTTMTVSVAMGTVTNDNVSLLEGGKELSLTLVATFVPAE